MDVTTTKSGKTEGIVQKIVPMGNITVYPAELSFEKTRKQEIR